MANPPSIPVSGEVIEVITLLDLCRSCGVHADWIIELVDQGILEPEGPEQTAWRFSGISITRVQKAWRLQRDLGVNLPGIALALDLIDERERLLQRLQSLDDVPPE